MTLSSVALARQSNKVLSTRILQFALPDRKPRKLSQGLWVLAKPLRIRITITVVAQSRGLDLLGGVSSCRGIMPKAGFYAVQSGRKPGIYTSWSECEEQIKGFSGAKYKKFGTESQALAFINGSTTLPYSSHPSTSSSHPSSSRSRPSISSTNQPVATQARASSPYTLADISDELPPVFAQLVKKGYNITRGGTSHRLVVYTDGSGLGNGKVGARAGVGVWFGGSGEAATRNLAERVPGDRQTNNRGELLSVIRALEECPYPELPLEVRTDSQYTISCMTTYLPKWLKSGFLTTPTPTSAGAGTARASERVKNVDLIKHLLVLLRKRGVHNGVRFRYVPGHSGEIGNEAADKLAKLGASGPPVPDRTNWLDPDQDNVEVVPGPSEVEVEVDESWLMSPEELKGFEKDFVEA